MDHFNHLCRYYHSMPFPSSKKTYIKFFFFFAEKLTSSLKLRTTQKKKKIEPT